MPDYAGVMKAVAAELEALKPEFPQLADFSAARHLNLPALTISYAFHTHRPERRGGWTSGVPHPHDDGIWFHLDLHDPGSTAQIHTQPIVPSMRLGDKIVWLLILEGAKTPRLSERLWEILRRHGAVGKP